MNDFGGGTSIGDAYGSGGFGGSGGGGGRGHFAPMAMQSDYGAPALGVGFSGRDESAFTSIQRSNNNLVDVIAPMNGCNHCGGVGCQHCSTTIINQSSTVIDVEDGHHHHGHGHHHHHQHHRVPVRPTPHLTRALTVLVLIFALLALSFAFFRTGGSSVASLGN